MKETIELRDNPELKINLTEYEIEVIDSSQPKNSTNLKLEL